MANAEGKAKKKVTTSQMIIGGIIWAILLFVLYLTFSGDSYPKQVSQARDDLTVSYVKNKQYAAPDCDTIKEIDKEYFIRCREAGNYKVIGAVYAIEIKENGYNIYTVNGRASQHHKEFISYIHTVEDVNELRVAQANKISKIIEEFKPKQ